MGSLLAIYAISLDEQSRTMRYVYTRMGDEEVRRNVVEYVHVELCAFGIVEMAPCVIPVNVAVSALICQTKNRSTTSANS